jgi:plasmid stabilization system protein ParE
VAFRKNAEKKIAGLKRFPESGRLIPDLPFREVIVHPDRFFYRIKDKTVWIVAPWHSAQLPHEPEK